MGNLSIFLVDDQPLTNFINKKLIAVTGVCKRVEDFVNPVTALDQLEDKNPDLVLLDLNMPEVNGWEFLEKMNEINTTAKVVIVTSSTSKLDQQKAEQYPRVIDFLIKPLSKNNMLSLEQRFNQ